jgi:hypothetical protein
MPRFGKQTQLGPPWAGPGPPGRRCETNPIRRQVVAGQEVMVNWSARRFRRNERAVLRSNAQNKANSSLADLGLGIDLWPAASGLCRAIAPNKPNSARRAGLVPGEGDCAKQSQFPAGPDGRALRPIMRNKANSRRGREDGGREPFPGRWRKTKPIWGSTRGGSLLCETKPIRWQVVEGKGFMVDWSARRFHRNERTLLRSNAPNKPNLGESAGGRNTQDSTILSFHHSSPIPIVRNKANFHRECRRALERTSGWPDRGDIRWR